MADTKKPGVDTRAGEEEDLPPFPTTEQVNIARANTYVTDPADLVEIPPTVPVSPPPPPPPVSDAESRRKGR